MAAVTSTDADLPKALVKRIVKGKLAQVDIANGGDGSRDFQVNKDALLAFCESGKVFIHYLTATANDVCKESKRQTISADDVIAALEELDFGELVPGLREALEAYKVEAREKNKKKAEATKKRKAGKELEGAGEEEQRAAEDGAGGAAEEEEAEEQQEQEVDGEDAEQGEQQGQESQHLQQQTIPEAELAEPDQQAAAEHGGT
ncbi:hypothetical protein N2152v2_000718 [Parachlorella kessleri]